MPGPEEAEVYMPGNGPNFSTDWEELKWRTFAPPDRDDALDARPGKGFGKGKFQTSAQPFPT
eukprot:2720568-Alexandrium_andersonii.AAC.1